MYQYQTQESWSFWNFVSQHPIWSLIIFVFVFRWFVRWFFGVNKLRDQQDRYSEMMQEHNELLSRQNDMLQRHESVISKLGDKYLS